MAPALTAIRGHPLHIVCRADMVLTWLGINHLKGQDHNHNLKVVRVREDLHGRPVTQ